MKTDKPLVSVLLAVYDPNPKWFSELLVSLNGQNYANIELLIYDDCPEHPFDEADVQKYITAFPYKIIRGEKNLGSNRAFEILTAAGSGKYFSYCDQDDVWFEEKIASMVSVLEKTASPLVCSDMCIIDGDGKRTANSINEIRRRHIFLEGEGLAGGLLIKNFVTGCAMMMRSDIAKASLPFVKTLVHDQWLAVNAALAGRIEFIKEPLLDYRQHSNNQTGILSGIYDKQTYYEERIAKYLLRIYELRERLSSDELKNTFAELSALYEARDRYFKKFSFKDFGVMCKYKKYCKSSVTIELFMKIIPNALFKFIIKRIKAGKL